MPAPFVACTGYAGTGESRDIVFDMLTILWFRVNTNFPPNWSLVIRNYLTDYT